MSHIVTIKTQVRDRAAVQQACRRLRLEAAEEGTFRLFSGEVTGLGLRLPGWQFPVVCQLDRGELRYDNFRGHWGEQSQLDQFLQAYAVERTRLEARKRGHTVVEQKLQDGSVKLTVQVGGAQ